MKLMMTTLFIFIYRTCGMYVLLIVRTHARHITTSCINYDFIVMFLIIYICLVVS